MTSARLKRIALLVPDRSMEEREFFRFLASLLGRIAGADVRADEVVLAPSNPPGALPEIAVMLAEVDFPKLVFEPAEGLDLRVGPFQIQASFDTVEMAQRPFGDEGRDDRFLSIEELWPRLRDHVVRVDHVGVNLPVSRVERAVWDAFLHHVAAISTVYRYPTGEEWPFVIPSTAEEFESDIRRFVAGREPKFEIVYDAYASGPVIQFNLETDLSRPDLEALFPEPYGVAFPGLEELFRTVYVRHPWHGLAVRFDLSYAGDGEVTDWETGEWLVREGGRIGP